MDTLKSQAYFQFRLTLQLSVIIAGFAKSLFVLFKEETCVTLQHPLIIEAGAKIQQEEVQGKNLLCVILLVQVRNTAFPRQECRPMTYSSIPAMRKSRKAWVLPTTDQLLGQDICKSQDVTCGERIHSLLALLAQNITRASYVVLGSGKWKPGLASKSYKLETIKLSDGSVHQLIISLVDGENEQAAKLCRARPMCTQSTISLILDRMTTAALRNR